MTEGSIAIDLGAEPGRVVVGVLAERRVSLEVVHRFLQEINTHVWDQIAPGFEKIST